MSQKYEKAENAAEGVVPARPARTWDFGLYRVMHAKSEHGNFKGRRTRAH